MHGAFVGFIWILSFIVFYLLKYVENHYVRMIVCLCLLVTMFKLNSYSYLIDNHIVLPPPTVKKDL